MSARDKIIRCPVLLKGGPRDSETIHVPPDSDLIITVIGRSRSEYAGVKYVKSPVLTYRLAEAPDPDRLIFARFISIRPSRTPGRIMSSADDLRTAIADLPTCWYCPTCECVIDSGDLAADGRLIHWPDRAPDGYPVDAERTHVVQQVAVLVPSMASDPVRRLAILDAMGLWVIEGQLYHSPHGWWQVNRFTLGKDEHNEPALVVRPRGEAT